MIIHKSQEGIGQTLIVVAVLLLCVMAHAQSASCPIEIESSIRHPLTSDMGPYGSALHIAIRNTSPFPILGIELAVQAINPDKNLARPNAIVSYHVLAPNATDMLMWNATRFDKKNGSPQAFDIWPALIQFNDGSKWIGNPTQCVYRSSASIKVEENKQPEAQKSEQELQDLIAKGQASLVNVTTDPTGANVDVDGVLTGKTPLTMVLMKNRNGKPRNIMVYKNGFAIKDRDVKPTGGTITVHERLIAVPSVR